MYKETELHEAALMLLTGAAETFPALPSEMSLPRHSLDHFTHKVLALIKVKNVKSCQKLVKGGKIGQHVISDAMKQVQRSLVGRPTHLSQDEEVLIVAAAKIKAAHGLPSTRKVSSAKLHTVLCALNLRQNSDTQMKSKLQFARRVITRVNRIEDDKVGQTK